MLIDNCSEGPISWVQRKGAKPAKIAKGRSLLEKGAVVEGDPNPQSGQKDNP